jgi:hypothetical protein
MTFVTFPAFKQRVQTRTRCALPPTIARMPTRFGSHRRFVSLWAWLTV